MIEGKTKIVYDLPDQHGQVFIQSKDRITAGDGAKSHAMEGKAAISTSTTSSIFNLLNTAGNFQYLMNKISLHVSSFQNCFLVFKKTPEQNSRG